MSDTKLWKADGFIADDPWSLLDEETMPDALATPITPESNAKLLVPLAHYLALSDSQRQAGKIGIVLAPADDVARLKPYLEHIALIAVTFPAFSDGRAYSQASLLRSRYGYEAEIRAIGDVLIDQIPLMLRCGINTFAVSNATAIRRLSEGRLPAISAHYQPSAQSAAPGKSYSWRHRSGSPA